VFSSSTGRAFGC